MNTVLVFVAVGFVAVAAVKLYPRVKAYIASRKAGK